VASFRGEIKAASNCELVWDVGSILETLSGQRNGETRPIIESLPHTGSRPSGDGRHFASKGLRVRVPLAPPQPDVLSAPPLTDLENLPQQTAAVGLPAVPPGLGVGSARHRARPMLGLTRRSAAEQLLHRSQFFGEDITPLVGAATVNQAPEIG
jgi:hypothetical protein